MLCGQCVPWARWRPISRRSDACYSYFTFGPDGSVASAAEKKVISSHASAGTYIFRTAGHFIAAAGRALAKSREELTVSEALFVCPVLNTSCGKG